MKQLTSKEKTELIDIQKELINELEKNIEERKKLIKDIFNEWGNTLKCWKKWTNIWFVQSLFIYVLGIILGLMIGGFWT